MTLSRHTINKIHTRRGSEFCNKENSIAIIVPSLYGLTTSTEHFRTMLADFLQILGFVPSRYYRGVWMILRANARGYDYTCAHIDEFKIVAKDSSPWIDCISSTFIVKEHGPRNYYLVDGYTYYATGPVYT